MSAKAVCLTCGCFFTNFTRERLDTLVAPLLQGYHYGLQGDLNSAFHGLHAYLEARMVLGTNLVEIEEELKRYCGQMKDLQANRMMSYQIIMWQFVKNLLGQSDDPAQLTGDVMNEQEQLEAFRVAGDKNGCFILNWNRLKLQISFEDWDHVKDTLPLVIRDIDICRGTFNYCFGMTDVAMASLGLFERTEKKKYRQCAQKYMKLVQKSSNNGVPLAKPLSALINAEWKAVMEDEDAKDFYDEAIEELVSHKFVAYETMAYQRVMHLMIRQISARRARDYLATSLDRHRTWGNRAKVEYLEGAYSDVMKSVKPAYEVEVTTKTLRTEDDPVIVDIGY